MEEERLIKQTTTFGRMVVVECGKNCSYTHSVEPFLIKQRWTSVLKDQRGFSRRVLRPQGPVPSLCTTFVLCCSSLERSTANDTIDITPKNNPQDSFPCCCFNLAFAHHKQICFDGPSSPPLLDPLPFHADPCPRTLRTLRCR